MSTLFKHFRVHQVFGANTNVGKTILTTGLVRASAQKGKDVFYLKPVSTGPLTDADDHHVTRYTKSLAKSIHAECLFRYDEPVSPHLAAKLKGDITGDITPPSDGTVVSSVANRIREHAMSTSRHSHMYIETAGGVHSPALSGTSQADCYRPLFLPTILIGDSNLGGISSTIASYESLLLRGYIIDTVLLFRDEYYQNAEYLKPYFTDRGIFLSTVDRPPEVLSNPSDNFASTEKYYASITTSEDGLAHVVDHLDTCHVKRLEELESMPRRALDSIWWPFVQHGLVQGEKDVTVIDSAYSDFFSITNKDSSAGSVSKRSILEPQFDGSASWWTQTLGHAYPALTLAAARASGRYGHVMFPQSVHLPALKLAERLVNDGPGKGWASRAFISDNGSTGMEVALKMALRAFSARHGKDLKNEEKKSLGILGLKGSYHGDTIGAMDACEEGVYTCEWHNAKGYWLDPPTVGFKDGEVFVDIPASLASFSQSTSIRAESLSWLYEVENRLHTPLARAYALYITRALESVQARGGPKLAALVLEPLLMGAGGMLFVDPLFKRVLIDAVRGMPVIFDEVFVGLHRIGTESSSPILGVYPDISVNAKILTGGLLPLAVTLASNDSKAKALLHGHSYTATRSGRAASWAKPDGQKSPVWSLWDPTFVNAISKLPQVKETMALGAVLSIKVQDDSAELFHPLKLASQDEGTLSTAPGGTPFGIHYRTLGDVAYFMTSLNTRAAVIRSIEDKIWKTLTNV
ncbi:pyridoxal phosphate-dependent transferase [Gymnopilus junonius]|uniref:Pyridoxal phosphate-dependent transferase n=1 Tax=Gymnopilus junonius TaxID=109634 RepID=A0A9P5NW75_GYMJU|nr:pyridoxal phosphate-dependent transferase [Gymnopilus junonius]